MPAQSHRALLQCAKNSRRVATRYDKLIESFAAFVLLLHNFASSVGGEWS